MSLYARFLHDSRLFLAKFYCALVQLRRSLQFPLTNLLDMDLGNEVHQVCRCQPGNVLTASGPYEESVSSTFQP